MAMVRQPADEIRRNDLRCRNNTNKNAYVERIKTGLFEIKGNIRNERTEGGKIKKIKPR